MCDVTSVENGQLEPLHRLSYTPGRMPDQQKTKMMGGISDEARGTKKATNTSSFRSSVASLVCTYDEWDPNTVLVRIPDDEDEDYQTTTRGRDDHHRSSSPIYSNWDLSSQEHLVPL